MALVVIAVSLLAIAQVPYKVEGVYRGGTVFSCLCDSRHYIRIYQNKVICYSIGHRSAIYVGDLVKQEDGTYLVERDSSAIEEGYVYEFRIKRSFLGGLSIKYEDNYSGMPLINETLLRSYVGADVAKAIDTSEIESVYVVGGDKIYDYFDKDYNLLRREIRPIEKKEDF